MGEIYQHKMEYKSFEIKAIQRTIGEYLHVNVPLSETWEFESKNSLPTQ